MDDIAGGQPEAPDPNIRVKQEEPDKEEPSQSPTQEPEHEPASSAVTEDTAEESSNLGTADQTAIKTEPEEKSAADAEAPATVDAATAASTADSGDTAAAAAIEAKSDDANITAAVSPLPDASDVQEIVIKPEPSDADDQGSQSKPPEGSTSRDSASESPPPSKLPETSPPRGSSPTPTSPRVTKRSGDEDDGDVPVAKRPRSVKTELPVKPATSSRGKPSAAPPVAAVDDADIIIVLSGDETDDDTPVVMATDNAKRGGGEKISNTTSGPEITTQKSSSPKAVVENLTDHTQSDVEEIPRYSNHGSNHSNILTEEEDKSMDVEELKPRIHHDSQSASRDGVETPAAAEDAAAFDEDAFMSSCRDYEASGGGRGKEAEGRKPRQFGDWFDRGRSDSDEEEEEGSEPGEDFTVNVGGAPGVSVHQLQRALGKMEDSIVKRLKHEMRHQGAAPPPPEKPAAAAEPATATPAPPKPAKKPRWSPRVHDVSAEIRSRIVTGKYVQLYELLPSQSEMDAPSPTPAHWRTAWSVYRDVYLARHPREAPDLAIYARDVQIMMDLGAAWYSYDILFRMDRETTACKWTDFRLDLARKAYVNVKNGGGGGGGGTGAVTTTKAHVPASSAKTSLPAAVFGHCTFYNDENMQCLIDDCKFRHSCAKCDGRHPVYECDGAGGGGGGDVTKKSGDTATNAKGGVPYGYCFRYHDGGTCTSSTCRYKHSCYKCPADHPISTCKVAKIEANAASFIAKAQKVKPQVSPVSVGGVARQRSGDRDRRRDATVGTSGNASATVRTGYGQPLTYAAVRNSLGDQDHAHAHTATAAAIDLTDGASLESGSVKSGGDLGEVRAARRGRWREKPGGVTHAVPPGYCFEFNMADKTCERRFLCSYKHVCARCDGDHPEFTCRISK